MQNFSITFNVATGIFEAKLSEVCKTSPFIPVTIGLNVNGGVVFVKAETIRDDQGDLKRVDYTVPDSDLKLSIINDLY